MNIIVVQVKDKTQLDKTAHQLSRIIPKFYQIIIPEELYRKEKETQKLLNFVLAVITTLSLFSPSQQDWFQGSIPP